MSILLLPREILCLVALKLGNNSIKSMLLTCKSIYVSLNYDILWHLKFSSEFPSLHSMEKRNIQSKEQYLKFLEDYNALLDLLPRASTTVFSPSTEIYNMEQIAKTAARSVLIDRDRVFLCKPKLPIRVRYSTLHGLYEVDDWDIVVYRGTKAISSSLLNSVVGKYAVRTDIEAENCMGKSEHIGCLERTSSSILEHLKQGYYITRKRFHKKYSTTIQSMIHKGILLGP